MYSDKRKLSDIVKQLRCTIKNLSSAEQLILNKRPVQDVYHQIKIARGGLKKLDENIFPQIMKEDLNSRINRLLDHPRLSAELAETLNQIHLQMQNCTCDELLNLELDLRDIELDFLYILLHQ